MVDNEKFGKVPGPMTLDDAEIEEAMDEEAGQIDSGEFDAEEDLPMRRGGRRTVVAMVATAGAAVAIWAWRRRHRTPSRAERLGHVLGHAAHRTRDQAGRAVRTARRADFKAVASKVRSGVPGLH
jgi:hypothetical protein